MASFHHSPYKHGTLALPNNYFHEYYAQVRKGSMKENVLLTTSESWI